MQQVQAIIAQAKADTGLRNRVVMR